MSAIKLHIIKPSVNNMTARVFVRAAKLDFTEDDVYGKTRSDEFSAKNPVASDADDRGAATCRRAWCGRAARSCSISATSIISTSSIRPSRKSAPWSTARCSISSARSIPIRARHLSGARLPAICGRGRRERRRRRAQGHGAEGGGRGGRRDAGGVPQILSRRQDLHRRRPRFHRRHQARLQPRVPACDRLRLPGWTKTYMAAVETALGDAYAEPAGDVEGYIQYVKGQKK